MEEADSEVFAPAPVHTPPLSADQPQARRTDGMTRQRPGRCRRVTRSSGSTDPPTLSACFSESRPPLFVLVSIRRRKCERLSLSLVILGIRLLDVSTASACTVRPAGTLCAHVRTTALINPHVVV
jgi:hypothetical protein